MELLGLTVEGKRVGDKESNNEDDWESEEARAPVKEYQREGRDPSGDRGQCRGCWRFGDSHYGEGGT